MKRDAGRKCVFKRGTIALGGGRGSLWRKKNGEREREKARKVSSIKIGK